MGSESGAMIVKSALICLIVGVCIAARQSREAQQTYDFYNNYNNQQQQQQQQRQQRNFFNQQQQQQQQEQPKFNNAFAQQQQQSNLGDLANAGGLCPERNGRFPVASQCDAYVECNDGVPEQKLCPEGLLFNPEARFNYPCGYPIDINCLGRSSLQPPQPTDECPHQFGYFKMGDRQNCGQFMNCVDGRAYVFNCPEGLAYNSESYRCDWPDQVADCDAEAFLGFTCPQSSQNEVFGATTRFFRSPHDCQHYYVCVNDKPRLQNCGEGHAFSELVGTCDAAENVTGCEPPQVQNEQFQPVQLNEPQQNLISFNQQSSFAQQGNSFNQPRAFGSFDAQPKRTQQSGNQFTRQRFTSTF